MNLKNEKIYYEVKGLNFNKFLQELKKYNVKIYELKRQEYNDFYVEIGFSDKPIFEEIVNKMHYDIKEVRSSFGLFAKNSIKRHIAMTLVVVLLAIFLVISSNLVYKIEIFGLENLTCQEVASVLNKNDIKPFKFKSMYDLASIPNMLRDELQTVSLASAIIRGSTLIININEKIEQPSFNYSPIVAPFDCIIKEIDLISGTAVKNIENTVKKGEVIVEPYILYKDGSTLKVKADARITAYVELSTTVTYQENHVQYVRSGNNFLTYELSIFGKSLGVSRESNFKKFEKEVKKNFVFEGFILPVVKTTTTYYEICEKQVYVPIENVLQNMIVENKKILYNSLNYNSINEISDHTTIVKQGEMFLVTTYLKATIEF